MGRRRLRLVAVVAAVAAAVLAIDAARASATYPGTNGRIAFSNYVTGQIYTVNPDGSGLVQLTHTEGTDRAADFPSWSPNGKRILFTKFRYAGDDHSRIWIMKADGTDKHQVTGDARGFRDYTPKFTPDSSRIVFTRCLPDDGVCAIWKMRANGNHMHALTPYIDGLNDEAVDFNLSISPNGRWIAFTRFFEGGFAARIVLMRIDGSDAHPITPAWIEGGQPDWSPDGQRIVFHSNAPRAGSSLFTIKPDGTDRHRLTANRFPHSDALATYSPQGDQVAFISDRNYPDVCCTDLFAIDSDGTGEHMIDTGLSDSGILSPSWGTAPLLP